MPAGTIGERIRQLRYRRGLSQTKLAAATGFSVSYISLLESGRRTPTQRSLETIAGTLQCSVEHLRTGRGGTDDRSAELDLRFAELALRTGDAEAAHHHFSKVAAAAAQSGWYEQEFDARWGLARVLELRGDLEGAIDQYECLLTADRPAGSLDRIRIAVALCRTYSECGDLNRAIDVGESALDQLAPPLSEGILDDAVVDLASTLIGCYFERGDLTRARLLARTALARAEDSGSALARASVLWNAALIEGAQGDVRTARALADRALALYSESDNARAISLLRVMSAGLLLRGPDPVVSEADRLLRQALAELPVVGSPVDIACAEIELGRCRLLEGDWEIATRTVEAALARLGDNPRLEGARARLLLGHAQLEGGDTEAAVRSYARAASELGSSGALRQAASAWRELAEALAGLGRTDEALDAYRRASDAAGVAAPVQHTVPLPSSNAAAPAAELASHRSPAPLPQ